ncbi:non-hydrolyzing UDP-N-acetylglucosamine 2-epimerase [Rosettibacter firmus]|uniref:non-hydrolyzing UDP-N-acetylglucosamine 2-epimerase n=1 Tax=Rosettibacter firmus TaxID=3111522 RepID=UPI00336C18AB
MLIKEKSKLKVMTVVGTRPEVIRLSRVIALLDETVNHILVHTGQNYDYELNEIFFRELEIRKPDYFMNADVSSLGATIGDIFKKSEEILKKEKPDALLVLGDTNSCLSAYMAKRMHIPIYHMEAGNRCFDFNVPEEINRRIIDHIADFNLVYTEHARRHLLSEGLPHRRIYLTGSPLNEVLKYYLPKIEMSDVLDRLNLKEKEYFLVSIHREENVDNKDNLIILLNTLNKITYLFERKVIVSTHPRTRKRIEALNNIKIDSKIEFLKPFGFFDYVKLQKNALCVISDSGTINEESSILDFPAITVRNSMERPEGLDTGSIILTGLNEDNIIDSIKLVLYEKNRGFKKEFTNDYKVENTSLRVAKLIIGTAKLSNKWNSIN